MRRDGLFERLDFHGSAAGDPASLRAHPVSECLGVLPHDQIQPPFAAQSVPVFDQFRHLVAGIDVHQRKRHMAEKGFAGKPQQHSRILAHRPQHGQTVKMFIGLAQDVDALILKVSKAAHHNSFGKVRMP